MEKAAAEYDQSVRQSATAGGAAAGGGGGAGAGKGTKGSGKEKEASGQSGAGGKGPAGGQGQGKAAAAGGHVAGAGKQGTGQQGGKGGAAASVGHKAQAAAGASAGAAGAATTGVSYIPGFNDSDVSSSRSSTVQRGPLGGAGRGPSAPVIQPYTTTVGGNGVNGFVPGTGQYGGRGRGLARGRGGPQAGGRGGGRGAAGGVGLWQVRGSGDRLGGHHVASRYAACITPGCAWFAPALLGSYAVTANQEAHASTRGLLCREGADVLVPST